MAALARWCFGHRLAVLLLWLAALLGVQTAGAMQGAVFSDDYDFPGTESTRAAQLLQDAFPDRAAGSGTIVWHTGGSTVRAPDVAEPMTEALGQVAELPGVAAVHGPYGSPDGSPGSGAADTRQISRDGHTAYATVSFDTPATEDLDERQVQRVIDTARAPAGDGLQVELIGAGIGGTDPAAGSGNGHLAEMIGVGAAAVVLAVVFGSLGAALLPIATALFGVGIAYPLIGLLGHVMPVADFAPMLGILLGLGVGIDYALFILTRHRRGLRNGLSVEDAAARAVATSGRAVVFAGATVCIALLGMFVLRLNFLNGVAIAGSLTVALTVLASLTLLPALLGMIGTRVLGRRDRRRLTADGPRTGPRTGFGARWSALVGRHPVLLGGAATTLILLLALPTLGLRLGTADSGNDPPGSTTRQAYELLSDGFGPGINGPLTVVGELGGADDRPAFESLPETLRDTPGVAEATEAVFDRSGGTGMITVVPDTAPQSERTADLVDRLRDQVLPEATEGSSAVVQVGGATAGQEDFAAMIMDKLPLFGTVVIALGCLLLLLAFRSIAIPLKAAVMNIAAVASAFGVVVAVFQWGWGNGLLGLGGAGPIEPFLPVIMIAVLFGLSMDYQVFLLSRIYEEWRRTHDNGRSVRVGLTETSRVINSAAVIMIVVFGAFVFSGDRIIAMFGAGLAAAVALDAFVLRTLLVPALMHLLGGANWWLPAWLDRALPKLTIEPPPDAAERPAPRTAAPVAAEVLPSPRTAGGPRSRTPAGAQPETPGTAIPPPGSGGREQDRGAGVG